LPKPSPTTDLERNAFTTGIAVLEQVRVRSAISTAIREKRQPAGRDRGVDVDAGEVGEHGCG
jgi:hypothetical protein